jgi:hypothetical protein
MSVTPPEAKLEYSRARLRSNGRAGFSRALLAGGVIGALLLLVAEFTSLYDVESSVSRIPLRTVQAGAHHSYALVPIALVALVLAFAAARSESQPALVGLGALGILAAGIAVLGDLPDAGASGFVSRGAGLVHATDVPALGLYLETLGAALLIVTAGAGLVLGRTGS